MPPSLQGGQREEVDSVLTFFLWHADWSRRRLCDTVQIIASKGRCGTSAGIANRSFLEIGAKIGERGFMLYGRKLEGLWLKAVWKN